VFSFSKVEAHAQQDIIAWMCLWKSSGLSRSYIILKDRRQIEVAQRLQLGIGIILKSVSTSLIIGAHVRSAELCKY
jgi:hypothetical protein